MSPVAMIMSCDGNCRIDEFKGKSKALERSIDTKSKKTNNFMLLFYVAEMRESLQSRRKESTG